MRHCMIEFSSYRDKMSKNSLLQILAGVFLGFFVVVVFLSGFLYHLRLIIIILLLFFYRKMIC